MTEPRAACAARASFGRVLVVADLYSLVHREAGHGSTFTTREEAEAELEAVLRDEPTWLTRVWIEPFTLVVVERAE